MKVKTDISDVVCYLCGSNDTKYLFTYTGPDPYIEKMGLKDFVFRWYRCTECTVYFGINPDKIDRIYDDNILYDASYDADGIEQRFRQIMSLSPDSSDNWQRVARITSFWKTHVVGLPYSRFGKYTLLDVGAGTGVFIARLLQVTKEFVPTALEISHIAADFLNKKLHIQTYRCLLHDMPKNLCYDLIALNRVVEHIRHPQGFILETRKRLKPGGIIYIEVPDAVSYEQEGCGCDAFASGHHMVYTPESLSRLLRECGLRPLLIESTREPSGKWTLYSFSTAAP